MKIYIAAHYTRKEEVRTWARAIQDIGVDVVSTWHLENHPPDVKMADLSAKELTSIAKRDFAELSSCTHLVFLSVASDAPFTRGGHCVELGLALGMGKDVTVVGPRQNHFCYLPQVKWVSLLSEFLERGKGKYGNPVFDFLQKCQRHAGRRGRLKGLHRRWGGG